MTYPVQQPGYPVAPQGYEQPAAPQYPQQGYPAQQPGFPMVPQQYAPPAQGYPTQQYAPPAQGYPQVPQQPQGYPQAPQQPAPPLVQASLDDFFSQPATGWGPAWSWTKPPAPMGTTFVGVVARPLTKGDIEQQTQPNSNTPMSYRDGRPVLVMKVPMFVQQSEQFPEGKAQWYVQGQSKDELARAMAAAGAPEGPPEVGAVIAVTWMSERRNNFNTMSKQFAVQYQRPEGAAPVAPPAAPAPAAPQVPPPPAPVQQPQFSQPMQTQGFAEQQPMAQVPIQQSAPAPAGAPAMPPAPPAPAPPAPAAVAGLDPEKAALLARLTGQTPAPAAG